MCLLLRVNNYVASSQENVVSASKSYDILCFFAYENVTAYCDATSFVHFTPLDAKIAFIFCVFPLAVLRFVVILLL